MDYIQEKLNPESSIFGVLGYFANNPIKLIGSEFKIKDVDFVSPFHKIVFNAIRNLAIESKGQDSEITPLGVDVYLSSYPKYHKVWTDNDGVQFLSDAKEREKEINFSVEYDVLRKFSVLRQYHNNGFDIRDLYDYDTPDLNKQTQYVTKLKEMTLSDIVSHFTERAVTVANNINERNNDIERFQAKDGISELVESLGKQPVMGFPFDNGFYNTLFRGMQKGKLMIRSAGSGHGKAVSMTTMIPMAEGSFKEARHVQVGDYVFSRKGQPTKVIARYEQPKTMLYKVVTSDKREQILHPEHLISYWDYQTTNFKTSQLKTCELKYLIDSFENTLDYLGDTYNYVIPLTEPVEYNDNFHVIPPYEIGKQVMQDNKYSLLTRNYLIDSIDNRLELLRGMFDVNGTLDIIFTHEYELTLRKIPTQILNAVLSLVDSLGIGRKVYSGLSNKNLHDISLYTDKKIWKNTEFDTVKGSRQCNRTAKYGTKIVSIEPYEEAESVCFTVDNDEHLFLINDYIVTHNTRTAVRDVARGSLSKFYEEGIGWKSTGETIPTLFISTELNKPELQKIMIAYVSGIPTARLDAGNFKDYQMKRIQEASQVIEESNMYFSYLEDFSLQDIESQIEEHVIKYGVKYIVFDYIQNSAKLSKTLQEKFGHNLREDELLIETSRHLKNVAERLNIFILTGTQLNAKELEDNIYYSRTAETLRGGKATVNKADYGLIIAKPNGTDKKKLKALIEETSLDLEKDMPDFGHFIFKNRSGLSNVIVWTKFNMGNMREEPLFVTNYDYELIEHIKPTEVIIEP